RMTRAPLSDVDDFRKLVDLSPDAILAVDEEGIIVLVNARTAQVFGYSREELIGAEIELLLPSSLHELHRRHRRAYAADARTRPMGAGLDLLARRKNGSQFPAEISLSPMTTAHGRFVIAVVRDVTERKQVAAALKESREWLDAIFQASRDGIIVEEDERIVYANHAFARLYGYDDAGELLGQHVSVVQASESNAWMLDLGRRRLAGEPVPWLYEFKGRRRDGRPVDLEASVSLSSTGNTTRIITVVRDISERKRVEEERARFVEEQAARREAEAAQQRWAFLAEASAILSSSLDYETTLTTIARLAVPTLGDWCSVDVVRDDGQIHALAIAHRDPAKMAAAEELQRRYPAAASDKYGIAHAIRTGHPELYAEIPDALLEASARDATHLRILREVGFRSAMIVPLVGRGRTLGAISLVSTDASRRFGPADLMFAEELASRAALAIDNARLYREAHEASRLKDEFLATLSHELRTPLNAMLGWARLLQAGGLDAEATRKALESIERNTQAQSQLVSDILDVSRIIAGKLLVDRRAMEVAPAIHAAVDAIRPNADSNGVELAVAAEAGPCISGDADRLRQVIWNLLSNAVKFTPRGGRVSVTMRKTGHDVEIEVADTGIGIARDFLPYVFDRFRQADASTTRAHGGLGLGLAIVRHIVESHGGVVTAYSEGEGAGARFVVRLPAVEIPAAAEQPVSGVDRRATQAARAVQQSLRDVRILVVDDEADTREVVSMTLKQYGASVATASRVSDAMAMFEEFAPDAVVADIGMPGEDGYSLVKRIRARPREGRTIPVIALTAYARPQDRQFALDAGFSEHLAKPVEPSELAWAVVSLLRRSQAAG
ncbi:MAG: PAS domain S-box protein, partial [Bacteroidales bacterium]